MPMNQRGYLLAAFFCLGPWLLIGLFLWESRSPLTIDVVTVVAVWFGLPGLALAALFLWLAKSD